MVDSVGVEDIFAPFGRVTVKRMFSGHGVYADGLFFAMVNKGEVYLKTDETCVEKFQAAGSRPFTYTHGKRGEVATSLWTLPASALEDDDEFRQWSRLALDVARRKNAGKVPKPAKGGGESAPKKRVATGRKR